MKKFFSNNFLFWIIAAFLSIYVLIVFVKNPGMNTYDRAMFHDIIYGTAYKPYVYRVIIPVATRTITSVIPEGLQNNLTETVENSGAVKAVLAKFNWFSEDITEYIIACFLMYLSLLGFLYAFRKFFKVIYSSPQWFVNLTTIVVLLGLPAMFEYYSYVYDFLNLFLFTLGLIFLRQKKWQAFLILYFISCFNKETTILLTMIFAIYYFKNEEVSRELYKKLIVVQLAIFAAVKILLYFIFKDNPGVFVEFHLIDRTYLLWNGYTLTAFVVWLTIALLIFSNWKEKPKFLKDALWITVPLATLTLFLGLWDEWRDYYEVYPVIMLLVAYTFAKFTGVEIKLNDDNQLKTAN